MKDKIWTYLQRLKLVKQKSFKAYALIYALMVLVLIAVFSVVYLNLYYSNKQRVNMVFMQQDLQRDTKLALLETLKQNRINDGIFTYSKAPLTRFSLKNKPWGLFNRIEVSGERQTFKEVYQVLTGVEIQTPDAPSLYFEHNDALKIGGSTLITQKAIVPRKGIDRAYINSKGKSRSNLVEGEIEKLTRKSKSLFRDLEVLSFSPNLESEIHSAQIVPYIPGQNYSNSFADKLLLVEVGEHAFINSRLEGHIKLIGEDSIVITKEAQLDHIQIYAPKIRVEKQFKGRMQCFAEQFIIIEEDVVLHYPSVLFLDTDSLNSGIVLEENSVVEGVIVATKSQYQRYLKPQVEFKKGSKVIGQVVSNRINTQLSGHVYGNVFLNTMFLKTKSSIYTNHLLDTEINIEQLPKDRCGIPVGDFTGHQRIIQWIEHKTLSNENPKTDKTAL